MSSTRPPTRHTGTPTGGLLARVRRLLRLLAPAGAATTLAAPSLNDTGQAQCFNGSALAPCSSANAGDASAFPRQDGRFGRDAQAATGSLDKTGSGAAGFDCIAQDSAGATVPPGSHACVRDAVTGLLWSTETLAPASWADASTLASGYSRCSLSVGWRLPTLSQWGLLLLSALLDLATVRRQA